MKNVHIDEDDWAEDMSAEAVAARQKDSSSSAINKILDDDNTDVMELFASFVNGNPDASIEEVKLEALKLGIDDDKVLVILFQILFSESTLNAASIALKAPLFKQFLTSEKCQKGLLGGFERTVGELFPSLLPKTPILLKALYDNDLVDEEVILAWGQKASKRFVDKKVSKEIRTKAEPFLKWLQEAEEDEEED